MEIEEWLRTVLSAIDARNRAEFAGLGLVFYTDRDSLPVHPLTLDKCLSSLPTSTLSDAVDLLSKISRQSCKFHDGFHLIDAQSLSITDVSQFLAPAIPQARLAIHGVYGARTMAARLASLLPSVKATAVYTSGGEVTVFKVGEITRIPITFEDMRLGSQ